MFELDDPASWGRSRASSCDSVDAAVATGATVIWASTGPPGHLDFEAAVDAPSPPPIVRPTGGAHRVSLGARFVGPDGLG